MQKLIEIINIFSSFFNLYTFLISCFLTGMIVIYVANTEDHKLGKGFAIIAMLMLAYWTGFFVNASWLIFKYIVKLALIS